MHFLVYFLQKLWPGCIVGLKMSKFYFFYLEIVACGGFWLDSSKAGDSVHILEKRMFYGQSGRLGTTVDVCLLYLKYLANFC